MRHLILTRHFPLDRINARILARRLGLVPEVDAAGNIVAWTNPAVLAKLRNTLGG